MKTELESERKHKLATSAQQYERACEWVGELQDKEQQLKLKQDRLNASEQEVYDLRMRGSNGSPSTFDPSRQSFSAGIPPMSLEAGEQISTLKAELQKANDEMKVLRAWNRQLDDALTDEMNAAQAEGDAKTEKVKESSKPQSSGQGGNCLRDAAYEAAAEARARGLNPSVGGDPPGLPSLRGIGSQ